MDSAFISEGFKIFFKNFISFFALGLAIQLPPQLFNLLPGVLMSQMLTLLFAWTVGSILLATLVQFSYESGSGIQAAFEALRGKEAKIVLFSILHTLALIAGFFCLVIPGFVILIAGSFLYPVLIFEGETSYMAALKRSGGLVVDHLLQVIALVLIGMVFSGVFIALATAFIPAAFLAYSPILLGSISIPLAIALSTTLYKSIQ